MPRMTASAAVTGYRLQPAERIQQYSRGGGGGGWQKRGDAVTDKLRSEIAQRIGILVHAVMPPETVDMHINQSGKHPKAGQI